MAVVWIPAPLRNLTGGHETVTVPGATVAEVIAALDRIYPGTRERLCAGDQLKPGIAVAVGTEIARGGLREAVGATSEIHFLPAISGGEW